MGGRVVKRGSVVLIRYPFTDLSGAKVRPAIIITPDEFLKRIDDVICLFVSSVVPERNKLLPMDFVIEPRHPSFPKTGLKYRSILRCHKLALLDKMLVERVIGEIDEALMKEVNQRLLLALGLSTSTYDA
jgi:mRNA interferase MazF